MNLYCIRCSKFTKNNNVTIHGKINFYSHCAECGFKKLETTDKEELSDLLKV